MFTCFGPQKLHPPASPPPLVGRALVSHGPCIGSPNLQVASSARPCFGLTFVCMPALNDAMCPFHLACCCCIIQGILDVMQGSYFGTSRFAHGRMFSSFWSLLLKISCRHHTCHFVFSIVSLFRTFAKFAVIYITIRTVHLSNICRTFVGVAQGNVIEAGSTTLDAAPQPPLPRATPTPQPTPEAAQGPEPAAAHGPLQAVQDTGTPSSSPHSSSPHLYTQIHCRWPQ